MLKIGHRGAAGHAPENTLASIEKAIEFGVDVVEIDIRRSLDGHLMVMHDARVDRTTGEHGYVHELKREEMQSVPTLAEVVAAVGSRAEIMIELKVRGIVEEALSDAGSHPVYLASFFHSELLRVRELASSMRTIALIDGVPVLPTAFALEAKATHVGFGFDSLEPALVHSCRAAGLQIFTWTVDDPRDIAHAASLGVDGIISNYPDRLP
ncbi:MAG TPA: glycerophosphodiester phosphodiesterase [Bryobacteraceae bacterium]|nr:glycerophosphodiester phosphodiesterase [Bryobacteraceae bacterium]